jgi:type VI secretion system VasD/TssJ family lipoprotein
MAYKRGAMRLSRSCALPALVLLHCSSPPPVAPSAPEKCVEPRPVVTIAASSQVNAGVDGVGVPVQVRLYQLKGQSKLQNALFEDIWKDDAATLGEDLLATREITVFPGQQQEVPLEQLPDTRVLSAVAIFRDSPGRDWLVNYDLQPAKPEPPCSPPEPRISIWLDRMKIQDGEGRVEAASGTAEDKAGGAAVGGK